MAPSLILSSKTPVVSSSDLLHAVQSWEDAQRTRKAMSQRGDDEMAALLGLAEKEAAKRVNKMLRQHVLWPWLSARPGLGGIHMARVIALIGDPRRFPGQKCSKGHTSLPDYAVGSPCPVADPKTGELCDGIMEPPRRTTGVRSVWHYLGLHCDAEGKAPRRRIGVKADWQPKGRASCMQPNGIAEHIVKQKGCPYRPVYDAARERLSQRGADPESEIDLACGPEDGGGAAEISPVIEGAIGRLRPIQVHNIARKIAVKAAIGDMFMEWKRLADAGGVSEILLGEALPN